MNRNFSLLAATPPKLSHCFGIRVCGIAIVAALFNLLPATAQMQSGTLGGPIANSRTKSSIQAVLIDATTPNNTGQDERFAQQHNEGASLSGANPGVTTEPMSATQNPLPVDIGKVRRLKVGGENVDDTPLRVGNLDVLAPVVPNLPQLGITVTRAAAANIPGNLNTPTQEEYFQVNLPQGKPIVLVIGKATAYVDGVEQQLRAAPLVMRDKIWLPVFSLAPLMGAAARLDPDGTLHINPTIQSVELFPFKNTLAVTVKTSAPLPPGKVLMGTLGNPPKLYLDFPGYSMGLDAANSTVERVVNNGLNDVQRIRVGLVKKFPDTTRIVLDLRTSLSGVMQPLPDKTLFALVLVASGQRAPSMIAPVMSAPSGSLRGLTIVVDAGHGGHDTGARGKNSHEKSHCLDIARRVRDHLDARGATVLMTRDGDYFVSLQGRTDFANSRKADLFVSVHINSSVRKTSTGTQTFFWTAQSLALAREVHKELVKATGLPNRKISQARFFVIRKTWMPSILTESAFISNPNEEKLAMDPNWRERVARGIAQGIANYATLYLRPGVAS